MRLVHTSDWHLGKRLFETSLLDDQAHALEQLFEICRGADALIIAGDVYDRAVPPVEAVALLSDFLGRMARDLKIPVIAISGNHDSPERLGFSSEILSKGRLHVRTAFDGRATPIVIESGRRKAAIYCLPYLEPEVARDRLGDATITGHDAAVRAALAACHADRAAAGHADAILVGHLFAQGGRESPESERPLVIGGAAQVAPSALGGWSYVALGHLHEAQPVGGREDVRYSGSLLKYSFGEATHTKSVTVIDLILGRAAARTVPLVPRRDLVRIEGRFDELLTSDRFASAEGAFVEATYRDAGYVLDAAARLRQRFPHLLVALPKELVRVVGGETPAAPVLRARELLASFWAYVEGEDPDEGHLAAFEKALAEVEKEVACALAS
jgi:exonuclease SbcD